MATAAAQTVAQAEDGAAAEPAGKPRRLGRLVLLALPVVLAAAGVGLWFGGVLPPLLGLGAPGAGEVEASASAPAGPPAFLDMPDIVANLNVAGRRPVFVKLRSRLELARAEDAATLQAAMPRLLDLFQTYLREMRPEELRGSAGTHRLREELIARASLAAPPARVTDVLFTEILVQ